MRGQETDNIDFNIISIYTLLSNFYVPKYVSVTCIPFPGGFPLGPAHEAFVLGLFGSASGEAAEEGEGQAVLGNVSEGASLERLLEAQKGEQVKVCQWAEVESVSEVG